MVPVHFFGKKGLAAHPGVKIPKNSTVFTYFLGILRFCGTPIKIPQCGTP